MRTTENLHKFFYISIFNVYKLKLKETLVSVLSNEGYVFV